MHVSDYRDTTTGSLEIKIDLDAWFAKVLCIPSEAFLQLESDCYFQQSNLTTSVVHKYLFHNWTQAKLLVNDGHDFNDATHK